MPRQYSHLRLACNPVCRNRILTFELCHFDCLYTKNLPKTRCYVDPQFFRNTKYKILISHHSSLITHSLITSSLTAAHITHVSLSGTLREKSADIEASGPCDLSSLQFRIVESTQSQYS